jgi:RHS repeat-associated protein
MADPEGEDTFTVDALNRLTTSTRTEPGQAPLAESFAYNALGALATYGSVTLTTDRPRRDGAGSAPSPVPASTPDGNVIIDGGGRITTIGDIALDYNTSGMARKITRTTGAAISTLNVEFDPEFRHYRHTLSIDGGAPVSTHFLHEGPNLVAEIDDAQPSVKRTYLWEGVDHPLRARDASGVRAYYELDLAGNVRRLRAPNSGTDLGGHRYGAFGKRLAPSAKTPAPLYEQPFSWKGRWTHDWTSASAPLVDMRARVWSPGMAAFTSVDELGYHDARSTLWGWPRQNPISWSDPSGRYGIDGSFAWVSGGLHTPGPARAAGEVIGLAGYSARDGYYAGAIGAAGFEVGGHSNYAALFEGHEILYSQHGGFEHGSIRMYEGSVGLEMPFVSGIGVNFGAYRQESGEWGVYGGVSGGALGDKLAAGIGFSFDDDLSRDIDNWIRLFWSSCGQ